VAGEVAMIRKPTDYSTAKSEAAEYAHWRGAITVVVALADGRFEWMTYAQYLQDDTIHPFQEAWYSEANDGDNNALYETAIMWREEQNDT